MYLGNILHWKVSFLASMVIILQRMTHLMSISRDLSMKEGSLFLLVMRSIGLGCFRLCSWCLWKARLWKALDEDECMGLVPWRLDLQCKSS
jgi:hypothetical protein